MVDRPQSIDDLLGGLDRYNPDTTGAFEGYVEDQCKTKTYDSQANLALLKLYQFNPHLANHEVITNILVKALIAFPAPDFSLALSLLPANTLISGASTSAFAELVQKLSRLNNLLAAGDFAEFWSVYEGDDDLADCVADVVGFEEAVRLRILIAVSQTWRDIQRDVLEEWVNLGGKDFESLVAGVGLKIEGDNVKIPLNKENEAKGQVIRETVKVDQFARVFKRAYEQPA